MGGGRVLADDSSALRTVAAARVTDCGSGYWTVSVVLTAIEHVQMTRGIRNLVESLFTQLKRLLASFAGSFPEGSVRSVKEWI